MSDVRSNKPALPAAFSLALAITFAGPIDPADAGSAVRLGSNETAAAQNFLPTIVVADNDDASSTEVKPPNDDVSPDEAPQASGDTAADAPPPEASPETVENKSQTSPVPSAPAVAATPSASDKPLPATGPDYYTQRAKQAVKEDATEEGKPHPLQLQYPDQNVVVCEGGCPSEKSAQIVFMEARSARKPIAEGEMIPSSSEPASKPADSVITCEAGCYDSDPRSYNGIPGGVAVSGAVPTAVVASDPGGWVTTVSPVAAGADSATLVREASAKLHTESGSGQWMHRISKETGQGAKSSAPKVTAVAANVASAHAVQVAAAEPMSPMTAPSPLTKADAASATIVKPEVASSVAKSETPAADKPTVKSSEPASIAVEIPQTAPVAPVIPPAIAPLVAAAVNAPAEAPKAPPVAASSTDKSSKTHAGPMATTPSVSGSASPAMADAAAGAANVPALMADHPAETVKAPVLAAAASGAPVTLSIVSPLAVPATPVAPDPAPTANTASDEKAVQPATSNPPPHEAAVPAADKSAVEHGAVTTVDSISKPTIATQVDALSAVKPSITNESATTDAAAKAELSPESSATQSSPAPAVNEDKDLTKLVMAASEPMPSSTAPPADKPSSPSAIPAADPVKAKASDVKSTADVASSGVPPSDAAKDAKTQPTTQVAALTKRESQLPQTAPAAVSGSHRDPVVNIETADAEMANATATARSKLPDFWSKLEQPGAYESDFSLKVAIQGRNAKEVEHFWLTNISRKNGKITGIISNDPSTVKSVHRGQVYEVNPDKISDWLYKRNGKMVGNETMRPLLKRLPAQQAASFREMYEKP